MKRDRIVIEIIRRLNLIKEVNGYTFDLKMALRNPENEPSIDNMPMTNIFEFPEITLGEAKRRGASQPPIYTKELTVVMEHWYASDSRGSTTNDVYTYLSHSRKVLFLDGITLGRLCNNVEETEISRVYRPPIGNNIVGIGQVLNFRFIEDFAEL